jgi:hypothetical protein
MDLFVGLAILVGGTGIICAVLWWAYLYKDIK